MTRRSPLHTASARLSAGATALWHGRTGRQRAAWVGSAAFVVLKIAPQQPTIMAITTGAYLTAAWRAGNPDRAPTPSEPTTAPTCNDSGQKGPGPGGGAGMSIIKTVNGTAHATDDPHNPARTNITWETR